MLLLAACLLAAPSDGFAERLWRAMPTGRGNVVVSPTSLNAALGLLIQGVGPSSRAPLARTLGTDDLDAYDKALQARLRTIGEGGEAVVANAGFFASLPAPAYAVAVERGYGAGIERLGQDGLAQINAWTEERTKGRIPRLLESLSPATEAVLVNAVTFDGLWESPFRPMASTHASFASPGGSRSVVMMRSEKANLPYAKGEGFRLVVLPYQGGRYRMTIILPDAGDPARLLNDVAWRGAAEAAKVAEVDLSLPRFKVESAPDVAMGLKTMGLAPFFSRLDFTRAVPQGVERLNMVVQKTFVEVDEAGTKAAAATAIGMTKSIRTRPGPLEFRVDRPFAFVIGHVATGEPLFEGVVREP